MTAKPLQFSILTSLFHSACWHELWDYLSSCSLNDIYELVRGLLNQSNYFRLLSSF